MSQKPDTQDQAEFREYCRRWLDENRPPAPNFRLPISAIEVSSEEQRTLVGEVAVGRCPGDRGSGGRILDRRRGAGGDEGASGGDERVTGPGLLGGATAGLIGR